jgi:hypothetical protein
LLLLTVVCLQFDYYGVVSLEQSSDARGDLFAVEGPVLRGRMTCVVAAVMHQAQVDRLVIPPEWQEATIVDFTIQGMQIVNVHVNDCVQPV